VIGKSAIAVVLGLCISCVLASCADVELPPPTYTNDLGMTFNVVFTLGVQFMMGSPDDEPGRGIAENRHKVELAESIYVQTTEVTQQQWEEVMGDNPSYYADCGDNCPVENITWYQAVEFCNQLSEREGLTPAYTIDGTDVTWDRSADGYRLPTEAEWEYAARAASDTGLPNGEEVSVGHTCDFDANLDEVGWYCGNAGDSPQPVAQKSANSFGLHDTHGNLWEWCWDGYAPYEFDDPSIAVVDPTGPEDPPDGALSMKIIRGGSALECADACRSAKRQGAGPGEGGVTGLRVVRRYASTEP
jgi:formylglycine-generating enzyme required for sulfatase activity